MGRLQHLIHGAILLLLCCGNGLSQQQESGCADVKFVMYYSHIQYGGQIVPNLVPTFHDCLNTCKQQEPCLGVSYDKYWHTCFIHTQENIQGSILKDDCCIHARKACIETSSTDAPPTSRSNTATPTPQIEVGKEPPPTYNLEQFGKASNDLNESPVYENNGYAYDYYDYSQYWDQFLDISDATEPGDGGAVESTEETEDVEDVPVVQDDVEVRTRSTLPPTRKPTTTATRKETRPAVKQPRSGTNAHQATNDQPTMPRIEASTLPLEYRRRFRDGTTVPSVLTEAQSAQSRIFSSFSKFSQEQIQLLVRLGVINFPGMLAGENQEGEETEGMEEEDEGMDKEVEGVDEEDVGDDAVVSMTATSKSQVELSIPTTKAAEAHNVETMDADAQSAQDLVDDTNEPSATNDEAALRSGPTAAPTLRPELFEQGIGKPFGNLNFNFFNQQQAGPPGISNFDPVTRPKPTDAPGQEGQEGGSDGGGGDDGDDDGNDQDKGTDGGQATQPGSPNMAKTTPPSLLSPPAIPDSGKCPDPFERVPMSAASGGILQDDVYDVEVCKRRCLNDFGCTACDFNNERLECYLHLDEVLVENVRGGTAPCCDHFRKTQCKNVCYQHIPVNVATSDNDHAECIRLAPELMLPGIATKECPGLCGLAEIISISADGTQLTERSIFRQCNNNVQLASPGCITTQTVSPVDQHSTFTLMCSCQGTRCNGLGTMPLMALQLHLPLDHSVEDVSPFRRNGLAFNISYSSYDSQMTNGAVYNGSACIKIRPLMGFLYGSLQAYQMDKQTRLTISMWIKRTEAEGYMSLLATGPREGPIDLVSIGTGSGQIIQASVTMASGLTFVTTTEAPRDEWLFVAVVIGASDADPAADQLKLYVGDDDLDSFLPSAVADLPPELLQSTTSPLFLGAKPSLGSAALANFFIGTMDEVMMFSDALPPKQLQSVRDSAREEAPEVVIVTEATTDDTTDTTDDTTGDSTWYDETTEETGTASDVTGVDDDVTTMSP